jgi:hypothetical protein
MGVGSSFGIGLTDFCNFAVSLQNASFHSSSMSSTGHGASGSLVQRAIEAERMLSSLVKSASLLRTWFR